MSARIESPTSGGRRSNGDRSRSKRSVNARLRADMFPCPLPLTPYPLPLTPYPVPLTPFPSLRDIPQPLQSLLNLLVGSATGLEACEFLFERVRDELVDRRVAGKIRHAFHARQQCLIEF